MSFASGSYIVPTDTTYQDNGMLLAYGMVYRLLRDGVPVEWVIEPTKAHLGNDFTASAVDHVSRAVILAHGYRGGPFVIHAADVARARPIVDAWQALHPAVTVHEATVSFDAFVARHLVAAPTIVTFADGNEPIAFGYMNAAGIPDSAGRAWPGGRVSCPSTNPDVMCPAQVAGGFTSHQDGALFEADGTPVYCQMMSMHWGVSDARTALGEEVIREYRSFLQYPTHLFAECQAVNAIENSVNGLFLTSMGYEIDGRPSSYTYYDDGLPYAQIDGAFLSVGGSEPSYSLPAGGAYLAMDTVMVTAAGSPIGTRDVWMTGYIDGACPIGVECPGGFGGLGKVSYLGGHRYPTDLPISRNPDTNGVRYFLNALFEASCATAAGRPILRVVKSAPEVALLDTVTYTLDYENSGSGIARNVVLRDPIPAGSTFVSASSGGTFDGTAVTWNLGALAQWDSGSRSFTVRLGAPGHYTNRASLTYLVGVTPARRPQHDRHAWGGPGRRCLMDWMRSRSARTGGLRTDDDGSDGDEVFCGTEPFHRHDGDTSPTEPSSATIRDCPMSCHTPRAARALEPALGSFPWTARPDGSPRSARPAGLRRRNVQRHRNLHNLPDRLRHLPAGLRRRHMQRHRDVHELPRRLRHLHRRLRRRGVRRHRDLRGLPRRLRHLPADLRRRDVQRHRDLRHLPDRLRHLHRCLRRRFLRPRRNVRNLSRRLRGLRGLRQLHLRVGRGLRDLHARLQTVRARAERRCDATETCTAAKPSAAPVRRPVTAPGHENRDARPVWTLRPTAATTSGAGQTATCSRLRRVFRKLRDALPPRRGLQARARLSPCTGTCGEHLRPTDHSCPADCACPDGGEDGGGDGSGDDGETVGDTGDAARDDADGGDVETVGDVEDTAGDGGGPDGAGTSGCGCVVPARRDSGIWPLLGLLVGLLAVRRERRRRQAASARQGRPGPCDGPAGSAPGPRT